MINEYQVDDIRISLHAVEEKPYRKITKSKDLKIVLDNIDNIINKTNLNLILTFDIVKGINEDQVEKAKDKYSNSVIIEAWKPHNWVNAFTYRKGDSVKSTCGRPWKSPYQIQVDGTVNMCCFDYNGKLLLGNFLNQTMKEIFNGQEYLNLKKHHENGTLDTSSYICKNCDQRKDQSDIIIYNNKFKSKDRLNRTSTTYKKI
jgi:radical SAM protein with 4Fe4S-binding SPASM domain